MTTTTSPMQLPRVRRALPAQGSWARATEIKKEHALINVEHDTFLSGGKPGTGQGGGKEAKEGGGGDGSAKVRCHNCLEPCSAPSLQMSWNPFRRRVWLHLYL
jgi:hypothetical protein